MGNSIAVGSNKRVKIIKIDGGTVTVKTPATATDVLKAFSDNHVLLERESVKKFGIRAPKLQPLEELKPGKVYFLVEMPKFPQTGRAGERQEGFMKPDSNMDTGSGSGSGSIRVKMKIPRVQIEKVIEETKNEAEVAEKIVHLCLEASYRNS